MSNISFRIKPFDSIEYWYGSYICIKDKSLLGNDSHFFIRELKIAEDGFPDFENCFLYEVEKGDVLEYSVYNKESPGYWKQIDTSSAPRPISKEETIEFFLDDEEETD